jgi:hypothetical protein
VIIDFDYEFLEDGILLVDSQLDKLQRAARTSEDPDARGDYARTEHTVGLGFVICQQYLDAYCASRGISKHETLNSGPWHHSEISMIAAVNDAANHWKHPTERDGEPPNEQVKMAAQSSCCKQEQARLERMRGLGINLDQSYVLVAVLSTLLSPLPARFASLLPFIERWRDDVHALKLAR